MPRHHPAELAASEQRNAITDATSLGRPARPSALGATVSPAPAVLESSNIPIGVSTTPGETDRISAPRLPQRGARTIRILDRPPEQELF